MSEIKILEKIIFVSTEPFFSDGTIFELSFKDFLFYPQAEPFVLYNRFCQPSIIFQSRMSLGGEERRSR